MGFLGSIGDLFSSLWKKVAPLVESLLKHEIAAAWPIIEGAVAQVATNNPSGGKPLDLLNQAVTIAVPQLEASAIKVGIGEITTMIAATIKNQPILNKSNGLV